MPCHLMSCPYGYREILREFASKILMEAVWYLLGVFRAEVLGQAVHVAKMHLWGALTQ